MLITCSRAYLHTKYSILYFTRLDHFFYSSNMLIFILINYRTEIPLTTGRVLINNIIVFFFSTHCYIMC
nr:hypothetical protein [Cressdnaviricota sp.]